MAAGDLITDDFQIELANGPTLIGSGQPIRVRSITGFDDLPELRTPEVARPRSLGGFVLPQYPGQRVVLVEVEVGPDSTTTMAEAVQAFTDATIPETFAEQFYAIRLRGSTRLLEARIARRSLPADRGYGYGQARGAIQLVATDPRLLDVTLQSDSTGVGSVVGGLGFPYGFPHGFGTATPGTIAAVNAGNVAAAWTATLQGPLTSPRITVIGGDGDLELMGFDLAAGQTLEIDSRERTVLLNGTASRSGFLTRRVWFDLPPGSSTVQLGAAAGTGTLDLRWRSAWL